MKAEALIARVPNLPSPSPSVARLLELLSRPETDNDDVIGVVAQDGVLSGKLLALCNSAAYGLATPIGSIDQAVLYLGHEEIHRLVMAASFGGALSPTLAGYAMEEGALWRHSLLTAFAMNKVLAAVHGFSVDPSVAYTAGLIHDIGKVVMSHALDAATQSAVHELIDQGGSSLIEAEKRVVGADHAEIGACLLREWRLPEMLVEAVANHHVPPVAPRPQLSAVVHVADVIAHETGSSPGWGSFAVRAEEEAVQALGLESVDIEKLIMDTCDALDDIEGMLAVC